MKQPYLALLIAISIDFVLAVVRSKELDPMLMEVAGFNSDIADSALSVASASIINDIKYYKGDIFMTQGSILRKITSDGKMIRLAGSGSMGYNGDNIPAVWAALNL